MKRRCLCFVSIFIMFLVFGPIFLSSQGTQADYERALGLREKLTSLALNMPDRPAWIDKTSRFWYRKSVKDGFEFNVVDAGTLKKKIAFDHEKLASALASVLEDMVAEDHVHIGPFSHVPSGPHLGRGVCVGSFDEVKPDET